MRLQNTILWMNLIYKYSLIFVNKIILTFLKIIIQRAYIRKHNVPNRSKNTLLKIILNATKLLS